MKRKFNFWKTLNYFEMVGALILFLTIPQKEICAICAFFFGIEFLHHCISELNSNSKSF